MKTVFMIAEKPSLAQSIAKILSRGKTENVLISSSFFVSLSDKQYICIVGTKSIRTYKRMALLGSEAVY